MYLALYSRAENLVVVRQFMRGVAGALRLGDARLDDVLTAVSEAANNVVLHAYDGEAGPMEIDCHIEGGRLVVSVRDRGRGFAGIAELDEDTEGFGFHAMRALADDVDLRVVPAGGAEVTLAFESPEIAALDGANGSRAPRSDHGSAMRDAEATLRIAPRELVRPVLDPVVAALAARADLSLDRMSDTHLLVDAVTSTLPDALLPGRPVVVELDSEHKGLELRFGPLSHAAAQRLMTMTGDALAPLIRRLSDARNVVVSGEDWLLSLRVAERGI